SEKIYEDDTPVEPLPGKAARVAIDRLILDSAKKGVRAVTLCPTMIYGSGHGVHAESVQVPRLIALARKHGAGRHVGRGENIWSNVHIDDLVPLYLLALAKAPVADKLVKAGAIVLGKTNMHELAFGITSNNATFGQIGRA